MIKYSLLNQDINTSFLNIETTWTGMRSSLLKKQVGLGAPDSFCELVNDETLNYFQNVQQAKKFSHFCATAILEDKKILSAIREKTVELSQAIFLLARKNFPLPKLTDQEIIALLLKTRNLQKNLAAWGMAVAFADVYGEISDQVLEIFSKRNNLRYPINFYLDVLANPLNLSLTSKAYQNILLSKDNKYLLKKYFWLDQGSVGRGLDLNQLKEIRRHHKIIKLPYKVSRNSLLAEMKLSVSEKNLLDLSTEMIYIKSLRSDTRQALYVIVNNIVDLLAASFHVPAKNLEAISTKELIFIIKHPEKIPSNLSERRKRSLLIPESLDDYKVIVGEKVTSFLRTRIDYPQERVDNIQELKGQIAQPGAVRGQVKLVFGSQHNSKVKMGDIMVSVSTSPQLLPAMKLSAAFITDMGGITSHAAIVARELKTPCIVGTKIATKVLHDGDLVEVDANRGIVKIIKQQS